MSHSVATLEALGPLPPVQPLPSALHAQPVSLPILPVTFEVTPAEMEKISLIRTLVKEGGGCREEVIIMNILFTNSEF